MVPSLSVNNNSYSTTPHFVAAESFSRQELRTNADGSGQYSHVSSYRVLLSGHVADQNSTYINPTYTNPNLRASEASSSVVVNGAEPLLDGAKNILNAIETHIAKEAAAGASEQTLSSLLQQGLAGFKQGYAEAENLLTDSGGLNDNVAGVIGTLYQQVVDGLASLSEEYLGSRAAVVENSAETVAGDISHVPRRFAEGPSAQQFANIPATTVEYGRKDSFSFELTTLDGDTVSINATSIMALYGEYSAVDAGIIEALSDENQFSIDVKGELDEQEVQAIKGLLDQVMVLSDEFYNGDINKAYEAAINVGYDQNEIAGYALRLHQVEQYRVAATYQSFLPEKQQLTPDNNAIFSAIGDYAREVIETLGNPNNYEVFDYTQLLTRLSEQVDQQITPSSGPSFHDVIVDITDEYGYK